jgi:hypothetical protein
MTVIRLRRGTSSEWDAVNPVLDEGEPGVDLTTGTLKIGDGTTAWDDLTGAVGGAGGGSDWSTITLAGYEQWLALGNTGSIEVYLAELVTGAYGFRVDSGASPPAEPTVDGLPVIWIPGTSALTPVPTVPTAPSFNYTTFAVTPPVVVGVEYQLVDGVNYVVLPQGTATSLAGYTRPYVATVRAVAKPGYVLTGTYQWTAMFADPASLTLFSSDGLGGSAATMSGRVWDMAGGGSASGGSIPSWVGSTISVDGAGKTTAASNGWVWTLAGVANFRVEVDVFSFPVLHARSFSIYAGATNSTGLGGGEANVTIDGAAALVRFYAGTTGVTPSVIDNTYKTVAAAGDMTGTWKFSWVNKYLQVTAPDGQVFGRDYAAAPNAIGNYFILRVVTASSVAPVVDAVRLYR